MSFSCEEQEPSIWDYARFHKVVGNYMSNDPLSYLNPTLRHEDATESFASDYDLTSLDLKNPFLCVQSDLKEKILATRDSAALLASVLKGGSWGYNRNLQEPGNRHRFRDIKLEEPLLATDHEVDIQTFLDTSELNRVDLDMPCEDVNEENDEGLTYPESFWTIADEIRASSCKEKMHCTREVLLRLKDARNWVNIPAEASSLSWQIPSPKRPKRKIVGPVTQPLMPRESTPPPFIPPSPALRMPLAEQPETPINSGQEFVKKKLLNDDQPFPIEGTESVVNPIPENASIGDFLFQENCSPSPLKRLGRELPPPPRKRIGLRVKPPMTPPLTAKKRRDRKWSNPIEDLVKEDKISSAPELDLAMSSNPFESPSRELTEITQDAAKNIEGRLIAETIQGLDVELRCNVPRLDPLGITPPWAQNARQPLSNERLESCLNEIHNISSIPTLQDPSKDEERTMTWEPFQGPAIIDLNEGLEDVDKMADCLLDAEEDGSLIYEYHLHKSNIRRLKSPWSSMEVDGFFPSGDRNDFPSLAEPHRENTTREPKGRIKKRKRQNSWPSHEKATKVSAMKNVTATPHVDLSILPSQFSALNALDNFLSVRQKTVPSKKGDPNFNNNRPCDRPEPMPSTEQQSSAPASCPVKLSHPLPLIPDFPEPPDQMTMVLSNALLKSHRSLVFELEQRSPSLNLLFRDYEECELNLGLRINSDADIILSPRTGVILATSQATTQQYLPGQAPDAPPSLKDAKLITSPLRSHVAETTLRYEELYVLLSHRSPPTSTTHDITGNVIDDKTASSLASFSMFCASLAPYSTVIPVIISSSSTNALSEWLVALAKKHHVPMTMSPPLAALQNDPSPWEVFLRKAGFNPLAALYILSGSQGLQSSAHGTADSQRPPTAPESLSAFVTMPAAERRMLFSPFLGAKVLRRAELTLEAVW